MYLFPFSVFISGGLLFTDKFIGKLILNYLIIGIGGGLCSNSVEVLIENPLNFFPISTVPLQIMNKQQ